MSRKIAPRDLRKGHTIVERNKRGVRAVIRVHSVAHDERGGALVNELSLAEPMRGYTATDVVEVKAARGGR